MKVEFHDRDAEEIHSKIAQLITQVREYKATHDDFYYPPIVHCLDALTQALGHIEYAACEISRDKNEEGIRQTIVS